MCFTTEISEYILTQVRLANVIYYCITLHQFEKYIKGNQLRDKTY